VLLDEARDHTHVTHKPRHDVTTNHQHVVKGTMMNLRRTPLEPRPPPGRHLYQGFRISNCRLSHSSEPTGESCSMAWGRIAGRRGRSYLGAGLLELSGFALAEESEADQALEFRTGAFDVLGHHGQVLREA